MILLIWSYIARITLCRRRFRTLTVSWFIDHDAYIQDFLNSEADASEFQEKNNHEYICSYLCSWNYIHSDRCINLQSHGSASPVTNGLIT